MTETCFPNPTSHMHLTHLLDYLCWGSTDRPLLPGDTPRDEKELCTTLLATQLQVMNEQHMGATLGAKNNSIHLHFTTGW